MANVQLVVLVIEEVAGRPDKSVFSITKSLLKASVSNKLNENPNTINRVSCFVISQCLIEEQLSELESDPILAYDEMHVGLLRIV